MDHAANPDEGRSAAGRARLTRVEYRIGSVRPMGQPDAPRSATSRTATSGRARTIRSWAGGPGESAAGAGVALRLRDGDGGEAASYGVASNASGPVSSTWQWLKPASTQLPMLSPPSSVVAAIAPIAAPAQALEL